MKTMTDVLRKAIEVLSESHQEAVTNFVRHMSSLAQHDSIVVLKKVKGNWDDLQHAVGDDVPPELQGVWDEAWEALLRTHGMVVPYGDWVRSMYSAPQRGMLRTTAALIGYLAGDTLNVLEDLQAWYASAGMLLEGAMELLGRVQSKWRSTQKRWATRIEQEADEDEMFPCPFDASAWARSFDPLLWAEVLRAATPLNVSIFDEPVRVKIDAPWLLAQTLPPCAVVPEWEPWEGYVPWRDIPTWCPGVARFCHWYEVGHPGVKPEVYQGELGYSWEEARRAVRRVRIRKSGEVWEPSHGQGFLDP